MKKAILLVMVMTVLAVPAVTAQKINDAATSMKLSKFIQYGIEKSSLIVEMAVNGRFARVRECGNCP